MYGLLLLLSIVMVIAVPLLLYKRRRQQQLRDYRLPAGAKEFLLTHVEFFRNLSSEEQAEFMNRITDFLARTAITGIGRARVTDNDRLLVASSALIPIFRFKGWRYNNIDEVLLYEDRFSKDFQVAGEGRNILGMVGDGVLHRQMILSLPALREGFATAGSNNTAIHEFIHLLDKADGSTDGLPEYLLDKQYIIPWLKIMQEETARIHTASSDISTYAATNQAEFLAVVGTYFFQQPEALQEHHPELYKLLKTMFGGERNPV